jgi:hypothetical protein
MQSFRPRSTAVAVGAVTDARAHFQRQQAHRAGLDAGTAADAGFGSKAARRLGGIEAARMPLVPLTTGTRQCGICMPIIGPPMTRRAKAGLALEAAGEGEIADQRADAHLDIARLPPQRHR